VWWELNLSELQLLPTDPAKLMRVVTAAFAVGDMRPLFTAIHPDIVWKSSSTQVNLFRFSGVHERRGGVVGVTSEIASEYIFQRLEPKEITTQGEVVWGLFDAAIKYHPIGNTREFPILNMEIAIRWIVKKGRILESQTFMDTAALLAQRGA
jgi:ketosteroid isomerase-like protein